MYALTQFAFGHFLADRKFVSECTSPGSAAITCDMEQRQVRFKLLKEDSFWGLEMDLSIIASYSPHLIDRILEPREASSPVIFLSAKTFPVFKLERWDDFLGYESVSASRLHGLIPDRPMPPGSFSLMCTFRSTRDREAFVSTCWENLRIRRTLINSIRVIQGDRTGGDPKPLLMRLPFGVAFQLDKAINNRVLSINEALTLQEALLELSETYPEHAAPILSEFFACLQEKRSIRRKKRSSRRRHSQGDHSLVERLNHIIYEYLVEQQKPRNRLAPPNITTSCTYQLIVTPTRHILEGPNVDKSNSVLRKFGNHECFLRVSFRDEGGSKLQKDLRTSISQLLAMRYQPILLEGCLVAGRRYQFLGYSMSGLKEHSMWFVTPFKDDEGKQWDAASIRNSLGDFSQLQHYPARLGARWSQAFSATDPSITIHSDQIKRIADRKSPTGAEMTDGCSPISTELMRAIWRAYLPTKKRASTSSHPSALQFRLGGSKGMVVEDNTLVGKVICLRNSQIKFEAPDNRTFDIQGTSLRPKAMYLNRPLIVLLEFLGADCDHIIELQDAVIREVHSLYNSLEDASKVLQQHGLGASFNLPSLFSNMKKILGVDFQADDAQEGYRSDLLANSLKCSETHILRELKYRAHIPVPGSHTLYGVSDEWGCLEEGEIYATVFDEKKGIYEEIEGDVAITRSPQIHPGDVRLVKAVRREQLKHLTNVVVFSCKGDRSLASCLGGGDMDGDDFNLILDPLLHPTRAFPPGDYKPLEKKRTARPCDIGDVIKFIFDYIESDLIGLIAHAHLRFADFKDPGCQECLQLSVHASHAVDFPKTGTPVRFGDIPRLRERRKPDFLAYENQDPTERNFYKSNKLLGKLFRRVPLEHWIPEESDREDSPSKGNVIKHALRGVGLYDLGLPELQAPSEELHEEMKYLLVDYCDQLLTIGKVHSLSKNKDIPISEAELISGTLMENWSHHQRRREAVEAMNLQTHELIRAVKAEMQAKEMDHEHDEHDEGDKDEEGDEDNEDNEGNEDYHDCYEEEVGIPLIAEHFRRAWAAWCVAEEALREDPGSYGPQSFGFIALGRMLKLIKAAKEHV